MRATRSTTLLRASGLPRLDPPRVDTALLSRMNDASERLLAGDASAADDVPVARVDFLRWLAETRDVLFHGSSRGDLTCLDPIRLSRDTTEFGDQHAVYATSDPVWAIYFATLRRGGRFSTRNGTLAPAGGPVYPRWYFFSVNASDQGERFGSGSLYVVPRVSFRSQPPLRGRIDTAQWVSPVAVRPLARVVVTADDFPFRDQLVTHFEREPTLVTIARASWRARRQRSARR